MSKPLCACNSTFDKIAGANLLNTVNVKTTQAGDHSIGSLDDLVSRSCMKCCNMMIIKGNELAVPSTKDLYHKFRICYEEGSLRTGKEYSYVPHVLCNTCIEKILKDESEEKLRRRKMGSKFALNKDHKLVDCNFCKCKHKILLTEWNRMFKSSCCEGCLII